MTQKHRYSESYGNILGKYTFCEAKQQIDIGVVILKRGKNCSTPQLSESLISVSSGHASSMSLLAS